MDCLKHNSKISSPSVFNNYNNSTLKVNQNNSLNYNLINNEKRKNKYSQQKPIILCFDQMKYDNYFITPTNNNKTLEGKRKSLTNNKLNKNIINNFPYKNSNKSASTIKVETKYHNKSASFCNINKNNSNKNNEKKLKSSHSSIKLINNAKIKSHNPLKISKTLTEKTILNIIQKTPKNSKMSFLSSISSLKKTNYNSSAKTQKVLPFENYTNIKIYSNFSVFQGNKAKTQSELKQRKYLNFGSGNSKNNNNYNNPYNNQNNNNSNFEKNVKQKLIDRMNSAMKNNWNYLYPHQEIESKKILIQDISEIIQTPNKDNYFENSNSENKGRNDENNSDLKDFKYKNLQKYIIPNCERINDDEDFFSMTMNEKKVIGKTDITNDLIIIDPKNFGEKIKKNFNIIQSYDMQKPVNEPPKPSISNKKRNISIISILVIFVILVLVLIIGHYKYGWFKKKNDLIIIQNREVFLIQGFSENKSATNYYDF
jgi:hypothetical protein